MNNFVIIAGPQAAGKSTLLARLGNNPSTFLLQESRQIVVHKYLLLGAIFMTQGHEQEVVACDLQRMDTLLHRNASKLTYIDECNIFTIAHANAHGMSNTSLNWDEYITRLKQFNTMVLFIDVSPEISWQRRKEKYKKRLAYIALDQHDAVMEKYELYLRTLHPLLLNVFDKLPFYKIKIDGNRPQEEVASEALQAIQKFTPNSK